MCQGGWTWKQAKKKNIKLVKEKSLGIAWCNVYVEVKQSILNVSSTVNALARLEGFNKGDHTIPHVLIKKKYYTTCHKP